MQSLQLPAEFLGFAMVAVSNACWHAQFAAIPFHRRLLLLPHCMSKAAVCPGEYDAVGLHCAGCGGCAINAIKTQAEALGYQVIVAEGTSSVLMKILDGDADAVLGVACLDSLEKSFSRIADLGIPHLAVPLLIDGCVETQAEIAQVDSLLTVHSAAGAIRGNSYLPLLRETRRIFSPALLPALLAPVASVPAADTTLTTEAIALAGWGKAESACAPS